MLLLLFIGRKDNLSLWNKFFNNQVSHLGITVLGTGASASAASSGGTSSGQKDEGSFRYASATGNDEK
jgi:hypothetical protein